MTATATVVLWRVHLSQVAVQPGLADCLDADERARAVRFHFHRDSSRFVAYRGALRHILGHYLRQPPEAVRLGYASAGKPFLLDFPELQFNLSHAGDLLLVGVSRGGRLGVDIERIPPDSVVDETSGLVLSAPERDLMRRLTGQARRARFGAIWTRKEAYIKGDGRGMGLELDLIDVATSPDRVLVREQGSDRWATCSTWTLRSLEIDPGYSAAIAVEEADWRLERLEWPGP